MLFQFTVRTYPADDIGEDVMLADAQGKVEIEATNEHNARRQYLNHIYQFGLFAEHVDLVAVCE